MDHLLPRASVLAPPTHIIQFYSDDNFLLDGWGRLIADAVETGDAAICVTTNAHLEGLAERLTLHGEQVTAASEQRRYITLDAGEVMYDTEQSDSVRKKVKKCTCVTARSSIVKPSDCSSASLLAPRVGVGALRKSAES